MAADTFYFRLYAEGAYIYEFRYEIIETSPNDQEINNTVNTASPINVSQPISGHVNYRANGGTYDNNDYFRTIVPADGTMKIYVKGINRSGSNMWMHINGYDRRKTAEDQAVYVRRDSRLG
jgi:hypothetical protein